MFAFAVPTATRNVCGVASLAAAASPGGGHGAASVHPGAGTVGDGMDLSVNQQSERSRVDGPTPLLAHTEGLAEAPVRSERAAPRAHQFVPVAVPREPPNPVRLF